MTPDLRHDFDECASDAERARWLLTASPECLVQNQSFIRLVSRQAGFLAGVEYLDAELSLFRAPRTDAGGIVDLISIETARGRMDRIACGLAPRRLGA
jgi:hypothetical protein